MSQVPADTVLPPSLRPLPPPPVRVLASATLAAILVLAAGVAHVCSPVNTVAAAVGGGAVLPAGALLWRGLTIRAAVRGIESLRGACRCAGMLGLGVLTCGLTAAALPLLSRPLRPMVTTAGLTLAAVLFMVGLLQVPGVAHTVAGRLRHGLDGLVIGLSLALTGWVLMPDFGAANPLGYVAAAVAASCAAITGAVVLRIRRIRPGAARCGGGVALAIVGLALLAVTVGQDAPELAMFAAAAMVVAGPPLIWAGARRADLPSPGAAATGVDETLAGYPMLALPVATVALAFGYHLTVADRVDRTAVLLGAVLGGLMAIRELPATAGLRRYARRLAAKEAHLRALVAGASDVTMVLDDNLVVRWQSPAAARQLWLTGQDVVGRRFTELVHPDDRATVADRLRAVVGGAPADPDWPLLLEARLVDGVGCWRDTESAVSDLRSAPEVGALVVQVRDVGKRRMLERSLQRLTSCDQLTGLPNRRELLRAIAGRRGPGGVSGALLAIDLSGFCAVNDQQGRRAGDAVLVAVAQRLRAQIGPDDLVSRLGERQFALVTGDGPIEAYALGFRLLSELSKPYQLADGRPVQLVASIGLATLAGGEHAEEVVRRADLALRRSRQLGHSRIDWYDESLEQHLVRRLDLERHLPGAAGRGELDLLYQPMVELADGQPVGVAALLRWRHPVLGTVLPGELLPVADKLQISAEIGEWALHAACRQVASWRRRGYDLSLTLSVSGHQLTADGFVPEVAAALSVHRNPPERLTVAVPEPEITDDLPTVAAQLSKLRALGVRTGLADLRTGRTDLAQLRRLPLDVVTLSAGEMTAGELAAAVVDVARRLGVAVVADGLQSPEQRELVRGIGCRYGQGPLIAEPSPAEHVEAYLERLGTGDDGELTGPDVDPGRPGSTTS